MTDRPTGELYSRVYLRPTELTEDSPLARARIGHFLCSRLPAVAANVLAQAARELFGKGPRYAPYYDWDEFVPMVRLQDFLNLITLAQKQTAATFDRLSHSGITAADHNQLKGFIAEWLPFCRMVFSDEGLNYRIDEAGGVHPLVDEEFQTSRQTLLAVLDAPRYAGARSHFEDAHRHFGKQPAETKEAIWSMFQCVETVFQLLVGGRLNSGNIRDKLTPKLVEKYSADDSKAWKKITDSMADWTDAFHLYRHGQPDESPRIASPQLAIYALSSGATFTRILAELDRSYQHL
jgi:hypothetical protein